MAGLLLGLGILLAGCGDRQSTAEDIATPEDTQTDRIVVGFSQVGAESDWRSANTESMKSTFTKEAGYDLIFEDGQQKQANQIRAIRTFIQQEVDYIVLAPVTSHSMWENTYPHLGLSRWSSWTVRWMWRMTVCSPASWVRTLNWKA